MDITPVTLAVRTLKVRMAKASESKSGSAAKAQPVAKVRKRRTVGTESPKPVHAARKPKPYAFAPLRKGPRGKSVAATATASDRHQAIATAAYFLAEQRNFAPGQELQDWLTAERLLQTR